MLGACDSIHELADAIELASEIGDEDAETESEATATDSASSDETQDDAVVTDETTTADSDSSETSDVPAIELDHGLEILAATDVTTGDCASDQDLQTLVCASEAFLATLSETERASVLLDWTDSEARTIWSNLPGVTRNGLYFGDLGEESLAAAMVVVRAALSDAGYADFVGVLAADAYLGSLGGMGGGATRDMGTPPDDGMVPPDGAMPIEIMTPPDGMMPEDGLLPGGDMMSDGMGAAGGNTYSANNYAIAFIGNPSTTDNWMLQIGGHHMAYNITYHYGEGYPVPNHIAVEPKSAFEVSATSYTPLADEGDAMVAMFNGLDATQLSTAFLDGETYSDVLMGPDNGSGSMPTGFTEGEERAGVLVYELSSEQQAQVIEAIEAWVADYPADVADPLIADYTSEEALADTYIAWAGSQEAGVDVDVANTYMRIDGPRLWIEMACQNGVVVSDETHYHTMFRDKQMDYANSL